MRRTETPRLQRWLLRACVIVPLLMLAANLLAWLRWGTDLPMVDALVAALAELLS